MKWVQDFKRLITSLHKPFPEINSLDDINPSDFDLALNSEAEPGSREWHRLLDREDSLAWKGLRLFEKEIGSEMEYQYPYTSWDGPYNPEEGPHFRCPKCGGDINLFSYDVPSKRVCKECGYDPIADLATDEETIPIAQNGKESDYDDYDPADGGKKEVVYRILGKVISQKSGP